MAKDFNERDEFEIRVDELFWSVIRHWRAILIVMIVFGILLGGVGAFREFRKVRDPAVKAAAEKQYADEMEQYDRQKTAYESKIENLREWIERQDGYKDSSLMLLMDPYNVYKSVITYYIDSSYEIMPETWYQNPNYTKALVNSYVSGIAQMHFDDLIDLPGGPDLTTDHNVSSFANKKICTIEKDDENALVTISIICDSEERNAVLMRAIKKTMSENEARLNAIIGEHSLSVIGESAEYTIDNDLANLQTKFNADYETNALELVDTEKSLAELTEPVKSIHSRGTVVRQGMKFGMLGLIVGLIIAAFWFAVSTFGQRRVTSVASIQKQFDLPVLAVIRSGKSRINHLDRKIASKLGFSGLDDPDSAADYAASAVRMRAENCGTILVTGTAEDADMEMTVRLLSEKISDKQIIKTGDVCRSASAVNGLVKRGPAVCVEQWPKAALSDVEKELRILQTSDNECLGFIFVV